MWQVVLMKGKALWLGKGLRRRHGGVKRVLGGWLAREILRRAGVRIGGVGVRLVGRAMDELLGMASGQARRHRHG